MTLVVLYIDVENLLDKAKEAILSVVEDWPSEVSELTTLVLYTKADQTGLWQIWTADKFRYLDVQVKGVQHFTSTGSKNSADISIALDALADLLQERANHIAIFSDDSDFASLFLKMKHELSSKQEQKLPFTWFVTDRPSTRSPTLIDFLPPEYFHVVSCTSVQEPKSKRKRSRAKKEDPASPEEQIAIKIIENIPIGTFKSADCKRIIKDHFPSHPSLKADAASFGNQFVNKIWPILEQYGVLLEKPGRGPRKYQMTEDAKNKIGGK